MEASPEDKTYIVPAFSGLGAPYWDSEATALITGITRLTGRAEMVRAALECIAYQIYDIVSRMGNPFFQAEGGADAGFRANVGADIALQTGEGAGVVFQADEGANIAFRTDEGAGIALRTDEGAGIVLQADGGPAKNCYLMQFQSMCRSVLSLSLMALPMVRKLQRKFCGEVTLWSPNNEPSCPILGSVPFLPAPSSSLYPLSRRLSAQAHF